MTTQDLVQKAELTPLTQFESRDVSGAFVSDMMSDVMAGAKSGNVWLTVQTHKTIIPAANLVDIAAIIITSGKEVPQETIDLASKHGMAIFSTKDTTFAVVTRLYELGLRS